MFSQLEWNSRELAPDKIFVWERSTDSDAVIVRKGIICRQVSNDTGQRQIVSLHFPGDLVNLEACYLGVATTSLQALSTATVAVCARDEFLSFLNRDEAANRAVLVASLADGADARIFATNLARKSARARVANLLCQIAFRLDEHNFRQTGDFDQPLSQKQIGDITSLTSIHINRVLRSFDAGGFLRRIGRKYHAPNIWALAELGSYDRDDHQRLRDEANMFLSSSDSRRLGRGTLQKVTHQLDSLVVGL